MRQPVHWLLVVSATAAIAMAAPKGKAMKIQPVKQSYRLTEPIMLEVQCDNHGDSPLVREKPDKSFEVMVHLRDLETKEERTYTMGRMGATTIDPSKGLYVEVVPRREEVTIAPHSAYRFSTDVNERLYLRPGKYDCFLSDHGQESNHVQLAIVMTRTSVDRLFAMVQDPAQEYGRREWAMDWLASLLPEFRLQLPFEDDSAEAKGQKENGNRSMYERFAKWWEKHRDRLPPDDSGKGK